MKTKKGSELIIGDEFKDGRLWYQIISEPDSWDFFEGPRITFRVKQCSDGREYICSQILPDGEYQVRKSESFIQFQPLDDVKIKYAGSHPIMAWREAFVISDDGAEKVKVGFATNDKQHVQLIPRERLLST